MPCFSHKLENTLKRLMWFCVTFSPSPDYRRCSPLDSLRFALIEIAYNRAEGLSSVVSNICRIQTSHHGFTLFSFDSEEEGNLVYKTIYSGNIERLLWTFHSPGSGVLLRQFQEKDIVINFIESNFFNGLFTQQNIKPFAQACVKYNEGCRICLLEVGYMPIQFDAP